MSSTDNFHVHSSLLKAKTKTIKYSDYYFKRNFKILFMLNITAK